MVKQQVEPENVSYNSMNYGFALTEPELVIVETVEIKCN